MNEPHGKSRWSLRTAKQQPNGALAETADLDAVICWTEQEESSFFADLELSRRAVSQDIHKLSIGDDRNSILKTMFNDVRCVDIQIIAA